MVVVAQLARAPDCGSGGRGFEPLHSPQREYSSVAERMAVNHRVVGSSPSIPASMEVWPRGLRRHPAKVQDSARGPESSNLSASAPLEDWPSRLMAPVLKTGSPGRGSWVRILHLPQLLAQVAKRLTRRSAKPVSAGPNPALSSTPS